MTLAALFLCGSLSACSYATTTLVLAALAGAAQGYANSQNTDLTSTNEASGTSFLKEQLETSLTKQCIYDYIGSKHVRTVQKYELCPQTLSIPLGSPLQATNSSQQSKGYSITAFFKREVDTGGMTKQCVYDYLGSAYTLTIQKFELCPLNAQFTR